MEVTDKPWGEEKKYYDENGVIVKDLVIKKGGRLSLQSHPLKTEEMIVRSGKVLVEMHPGCILIIPKDVKHRITGVSDAVVSETSFGKEKTIRYEDDYGRE